MTERDDDYDDDFDTIPPTAERVAARALVLTAVACRSSLEADAGSPEAEDFRESLVEWMRSAGLDGEAEGPELALLRAPLGSLDEQATIDASWQGEGVGVLAWALRRYDLPSYDELVAPPEIGHRLGFLRERAETVLAAPELRPAEELEQLRAAMFALHWRLRQFSLDRQGMDFEAFARKSWFGPLDIRGLRLARRDLAIDGRPLLDVPEERWRECLSIASERHRAANWLAGYEPVYSDVTADT